MISELVHRFSEFRATTGGLLEAGSLTSGKLTALLSGGNRSRSGQYVTVPKSLGHSPVWKAVNLISGDIATMPLILYRRLERGKERAKNHALYRLLRRSVGSMTTNIWVRRTMAQALLYPGSYSRIHRDRRGAVVRLELGFPDRCRPYRTSAAGDAIAYEWTDVEGNTTDLPASEVFHVQGLTLTELGGLSIVEFARDTIGRHLAAEAFTDDFFGNGTIPQGWFMSEKQLAPEAQKRFLEDYRAQFTGEKRFSAGLLQNGMKWEATGIKPSDAMLLPMLELSPYDAARFFNLPPHKMAIKGVQGRTNTEEENQDYYRSTLAPWCVSIEMEIWSKLLSLKEQTEEAGGLAAEFLIDSMLRATSVTRAQYYRLMVQMTAMSPNEVRERENMNPREGGDEFTNPSTTAFDSPSAGLDGGGSMPSEEPPSDDVADPTQVDTTTAGNRSAAVRFAIEDGVLRVARRLAKAGEAAAKSPAQYLDAIDKIRAQHEPVVREMLAPIVCLAWSLPPEDVSDRVSAVAEKLLEATEQLFVAASDCVESELPQSCRRATERLVAEAGAIIEELASHGEKTGDRIS